MRIGTNALLGYGRKLTRNVMPWAASGERTTIPTAAANHEIASTYSARMQTASSQPPGLPCGRKPIATATVTTSSVDAMFRATLETTWPLISASGRTSIERNRSMIPLVMSCDTVTAVVAAPNPTHTSSTPGTT